MLIYLKKSFYFLSFFFFLYIANILCVTKKPPKILTAAKIIAKKPKMFAVPNILPWSEANAAIIAALAGKSENVFDTANIFGFLAIVLAAVNIFGGFLVTQRMLAMYKKKKKDKK